MGTQFTDEETEVKRGPEYVYVAEDNTAGKDSQIVYKTPKTIFLRTED